jgi:DNA-binding MarR family transcriptional regulator
MEASEEPRLGLWLEILAGDGGFHSEMPDAPGLSRNERLEMTNYLIERGWFDAISNYGDDRLLSVRDLRVTPKGMRVLTELRQRPHRSRTENQVGEAGSVMEQKDRQRFNFMNALYHATGGNYLQGVDPHELGGRIGLSRTEVEGVVDYLTKEDLVEWSSMGHISITHSGVREVEDALRHPDRSTDHFPSVNILSVGMMIGSQIQQGTVGSSQGAASMLDKQQILELLARVRDASQDLGLRGDDQSEFDAEVVTAETQLRSSRTKWDIVRSSISRIIDFFRSASAAVSTSTETLKALEELHKQLPGV